MPLAPTSFHMSLRTLLKGLVADDALRDVPDLEITHLSLDSRQIAAGGLFVALPGQKTHGLQHAAQAVQRGAVAVCWEPAADVAAPSPPGAVCIAVPQLSRQLGRLADRFFAKPSAALRIAAVTGTNGKTTTAYLIARACERLRLDAGYMGTIGYGPVNALRPAAFTTPDCITVHRQLAELRAAQVRTVGMEVSSHALDQGRVDAVRIDTAVFTNLSRDHLDYHGTMDAYGAAKARLFRWPDLQCRVLNAGDEFGRTLLAERSGVRTVAYAVASAATIAADGVVRATQVRATERGVELQIDGTWGDCVLRSSLLGDFNAENLLAALAVLLAWNVPLSEAVAALERVNAPAGRMELCAIAGKRAVIDYAHTPDALEKALRAVRRHCAGRLIVVFGCGGDRDRGKRPLMGAVAERLADQVIVTDDNPRSEAPAQIVTDILAGMRPAAAVSVQHDRAAAIAMALAQCGEPDMVLIAGKGHEDYQILGGETRHFSDREVVQQVLGGAA